MYNIYVHNTIYSVIEKGYKATIRNLKYIYIMQYFGYNLWPSSGTETKHL